MTRDVDPPPEATRTNSPTESAIAVSEVTLPVAASDKSDVSFTVSLEITLTLLGSVETK
jgi:hypothetical protein